ncbi:tetratricopeptide repeat protein 33-like [Panulirus ornatus]|uniref:tetratricopeptide repeat protein 33-like n=1 Tax=Panulirus ornatus TaxID=150431 RepID=UPI003A8C18E3
MQAFGWKRKTGLSKPQSTVVTEENAEEKDETRDPDIDWLTATKRPKVLQLEDEKAKARRLSNEGVTLAEAERWWAAIGRWNAALALTPDDHTIHEMMAQAYMQVGEVFHALKSAESAVKLCPNWWVGLQTLGRAQLGLGEVAEAVKTFSRAVHICPDEQELWREDLQTEKAQTKNHSAGNTLGGVRILEPKDNKEISASFEPKSAPETEDPRIERPYFDERPHIDALPYCNLQLTRLMRAS